MSFRTIAIAALLLTASILGYCQKVTLPAWAWVVWALLLGLAVVAWVVVSRAVKWAVKKALLMVPISDNVQKHAVGLSLPVAQIHEHNVKIEKWLANAMPWPLLGKLASWVFRSNAAGFIEGLMTFCKEHHAEVIDARLLGLWVHGKVAGQFSDAAGNWISGIWQIAVVVITAVGIFFAAALVQDL